MAVDDDAWADIGDNPSDDDDTDKVVLDAVVGEAVALDAVVGDLDDASAKAAGRGTSSSFVVTEFGTESEVELPVLLINRCLVCFIDSNFLDLSFICVEILE